MTMAVKNDESDDRLTIGNIYAIIFSNHLNDINPRESSVMKHINFSS